MAEIKKKKRARNFIGNGGEEETSSHCYSPEDSINTRRSVDISRGDKEEKKEKAKWSTIFHPAKVVDSYMPKLKTRKK